VLAGIVSPQIFLSKNFASKQVFCGNNFEQTAETTVTRYGCFGKKIKNPEEVRLLPDFFQLFNRIYLCTHGYE